jgi:acyl carrier protein
MNIESRLKQLLQQEIAQAGATPPASLDRDTVLAEIGLDSLGFATLVVAMTKDFGLDPFGATDDIVYPESFGDLLDLYMACEKR